MASLNKVMLIGNLGNDAEEKVMQDSGRKIISFSLATTKKFTGRDGNVQEDTQWHRIVYWTKIESRIVDYLKKGTSVYVEGEMRYRKYTDQNGVERTSADVSAIDVRLLSGKKEENAPSAQRYNPQPQASQDFQQGGYQQQPQPQYQQRPGYAPQPQQGFQHTGDFPNAPVGGQPMEDMPMF